MKKIILVRHAKSSWEEDVIDHERSLNDRGFKDADLVSTYFLDHFFNVDLLLSSDAKRAMTTANLFIDKLNIDREKVGFKHELYDFAGMNLLEVVKSCHVTVNDLMIFGHNHALTAFANTYGDHYINNIPTCGVVMIAFDINKWSDLKQGQTIQTVFPRDLK